jgi:hypothetical protein
MSRKKGTVKTGGRKPGSSNKVQAELRERIKDFLDNNFDNIQKDYLTLEAEKRVLFYEKLLNYVISKKTDLTTGGEKLFTQLPVIQIRTKQSTD